MVCALEREEFAGTVGVVVGSTSGVLVSSWLSGLSDFDEQHNLHKQQKKANTNKY